MHPTSFLHAKPSQWGKVAKRVAAGWWYTLHLGAIAMVMAMSPSTYTRQNRIITSRYMYAYTWQVLPWFTILAALLSLAIIRIVVVTAASYGLSNFALEMVVRVLVLEIIPLTAALFVALRAGLAFNAADALAAAVVSPGDSAAAQNRLRRDLVPQVVANTFSVLSLATVSSVVVLVLAYLVVYGFSPWGMGYYTRTVGRVFDPVVTIGFLGKTVAFGLAVAVIPAAALLQLQRSGRKRKSTVQPGAIGLLIVLFLIEALSLLIKYF